MPMSYRPRNSSVCHEGNNAAPYQGPDVGCRPPRFLRQRGRGAGCAGSSSNRRTSSCGSRFGLLPSRIRTPSFSRAPSREGVHTKRISSRVSRVTRTPIRKCTSRTTSRTWWPASRPYGQPSSWASNSSRRRVRSRSESGTGREIPEREANLSRLFPPCFPPEWHVRRRVRGVRRELPRRTAHRRPAGTKARFAPLAVGPDQGRRANQEGAEQQPGRHRRRTRDGRGPGHQEPQGHHSTGPPPDHRSTGSPRAAESGSEPWRDH